MANTPDAEHDHQTPTEHDIKTADDLFLPTIIEQKIQSLSEPFPEEDVSWRVERGGVRDGKPWAIVLPYIDNRAIIDRLDRILGPTGWCNDFKSGPAGGVLCGISIQLDDGSWITKWDGADNTQFESVKGGLSGAMKRAGSMWGIGRYLYDVKGTFADINPEGKIKSTIKYKDAATRKDQSVKINWDPPPLPLEALPESQLEPQPED